MQDADWKTQLNWTRILRIWTDYYGSDAKHACSRAGVWGFPRWIVARIPDHRWGQVDDQRRPM